MRRLSAGLLFFIAFSFAILRPVDATAQLNANSFSALTSYLAGATDTWGLAVGDVNNDSFADVVVTSQCFAGGDCHTGIGVLLNNGHGGLLPGVRYETDGFGAVNQSVAITDMDGDGKPDLIVMNSGSQGPSVSFVRGNGDGTFQQAVSYLLNLNPTFSVSPNKLTVADVNGDGRPDIIVSDGLGYPTKPYPQNQRGGVSVLLNNGGGTFATAVLYDSGGYAGASNVIAADVNGDGFLDIVVTNACAVAAEVPANGGACQNGDTSASQPGAIAVLLGNGNGTFQQAVSYPSGGYVPHALVSVDLNRDGKTDVLVANNCSNQFCNGGISTGTASVLIGNGDGSFQPALNFNDGAQQPLWIAAADVDGDGLVDAAVLNGCAVGLSCDGSTRTLSVLLGNDDGTLQAPAVYPVWGAALSNTLNVIDLNNDGKPDVVIAGWTAVSVMLNQTPRAATTTTLGSQPNPSAFGHATTLTATVSSLAPGTPTGTITFTEGGTVLGTAPLANAVATLDVSNLSLGSHTIVASYSSAPAFRYSVSAPLTHVVKIATTTDVSSSSNPSTLNESVKFTANVAAEGGGSVSGTVSFNDGNTLLGSAPLVSGAAEFSTSNLAVGTHSITAEYSADADHRGSTSAALSQSVVEATTQVTVDTAPTGLTISADGVSGTAPQLYLWAPNSQHQLSTTEPQQVTTGSRRMFDSWSDGEAFTHTVTTPASPITYTATFKTQYLLTTAANPAAGGSITAGGWFDSGTIVAITATAATGYSFTGFSGDLSGTVNPNNVTMSAARGVTANFKGLTTTSLGTSPNPSTFGQSVTMTATVTSLAGIPGGSVSFFDGVTNIGTQPLNASGIATLTAPLTTGSHSITASYAGNGSFLTSTSAPVTQTVNKATTSTSVSSSRNPAVAGQIVTFTSLVTSTAGVPTGTVTFKDGGLAIGTGVLNASGQATFSTSSLTVGTHTITAEYGGATNFLSSSSSSLSQAVTQATTTTTLTSTPNPSLVLQAVTFTATVNSSTGGIPTGAVTFQEGKTILGSSLVNAGGIAVFITSSLSRGSHTIKAVYAGTTSFAGSSSGNVKQVVNAAPPAPTTTSLTSSPNPSAVGQTVAFTAMVTGSGTPTGRVTFKDGGKTLGTATLSAGQATLSTASLKKGSHSITATYSGDSIFGGSVSPVDVQVVN
jgi:Bacterial Ig-like domain (group 3)/FG-GAP-like repeat/Divergent InlB B-repeat domain